MYTSKTEAHIISMNYFCFSVQHNRPFYIYLYLYLSIYRYIDIYICCLWDSFCMELNTKKKRRKKESSLQISTSPKIAIFIRLKNAKEKTCVEGTKIDSPQFQHCSYITIDCSSIDYLLTNHNLNVTLPIDRHRVVCVNFPHDRNCYSLLNPSNGFANQMLPRNTFVTASRDFMC